MARKLDTNPNVAVARAASAVEAERVARENSITDYASLRGAINAAAHRLPMGHGAEHIADFWRVLSAMSVCLNSAEHSPSLRIAMAPVVFAIAEACKAMSKCEAPVRSTTPPRFTLGTKENVDYMATFKEAVDRACEGPADILSHEPVTPEHRLDVRGWTKTSEGWRDPDDSHTLTLEQASERCSQQLRAFLASRQWITDLLFRNPDVLNTSDVVDAANDFVVFEIRQMDGRTRRTVILREKTPQCAERARRWHHTHPMPQASGLVENTDPGVLGIKQIEEMTSKIGYDEEKKCATWKATGEKITYKTLDNDLPLVFVDTETSGRDDKACQILEVACILTSPDGKEVKKEAQARIRVCDWARIEPGALAVNGIDPYSQDWIRSAFTLEAVIKRIALWLPAEFVLVAHNAPFDCRFLASSFERITGTRPERGMPGVARVIDTGQLARDKGFKRWALATVCEGLGIDFQGAHEALADIRATREVFLKLVA